MNKKIIVGIISIVLVLFVVIGIFVSQEKNDIYGSWEVAARSIGENLRPYPTDVFIIYENGTCTVDGSSCTFSMNDDTITISSIFKSYTYEYTLSGDTLTLKHISNFDRPTIYYQRVS